MPIRSRLRLAALLLAAGCAKDRLPDTPDADAGPPPADVAPDSAGEDTGPGPDADADAGPSTPPAWVVSVSPNAPAAVRLAAEDVASFLQQMGEEATLHAVAAPVTCHAGARQVALLGDGLGEPALQTEGGGTDQTWRIEDSRCEDGLLVTLAGGGLLGRQYAAYEWLHSLGVRFFHPEQEHVPDRLVMPDPPLVREHTPAFTWRSVSLHLTHPLELGDAFRLGKEEHFAEARRYVDWQVRNGASFGTSGIGGGKLAEYGIERGFPRTGGFSLYNQQQGASGILDPDDPRSDEEQITEAIEARMGVDPERRPLFFSFSFNPTEFTEEDDQVVVRQMTFIADYMREHYPEALLMTTNHGSAGPPTPHYGVRYYDLPQFAPDNLGVKVHTLMFFDLERPAPVYGNDDFGFLFEFMRQEHTKRRLWYFPESAWWLTFDIAIPLYLPITIEARHRDIARIAFMLEGRLDGHRVFGSGHEWGYWQNEYCSFRMAADLGYDWHDCLRDLTSPMGGAAATVQAAIEEAVRLQERDLLFGGLLRWLVGTDEETEAAAAVGIDFHPLPPSPAEVRGWDEAACVAWGEQVAPALERMAADYAGLVARIADVEDQVPEAGRTWFDEVRDGLEVTGLRARHSRQVYGALITHRRSALRGDDTLLDQAAALLEAARASTEAARTVVLRREAGYRYRPLDRSIGGGPDGTGDGNWTIYPYRYLNRTHNLFYWTRIDELVAAALAGPAEVVTVTDALLGPGEPLVIDLMEGVLTDPLVDFGDGTSEAGTHLEHTYGEPRVWDVRVTGQRDGEPFEHTLSVASLAEEWHTGFSGRLVEPAGAEVIQTLLPALVLGPAPEPGVALGFSLDASGVVAPDLWVALPSAGWPGEVRTEPRALAVPVVNQGTGAVLGELQAEDLVAVLAGDRTWTRLEGALLTAAIIDTIVTVGGFEPEGARRLVADLLGYTPETLPEQVPFEVEYDVAVKP